MMPQTSSLPLRTGHEVFPPLVSTFLIVMVLFFVDEGYYDFRWMGEWGNWIVFVMYMIIFFPIQWVISHFLFRKFEDWKKIAMMVLLSVPTSLLIFWLVF